MGSHSSHIADEASSGSNNSIQKFDKRQAQKTAKKQPSVGMRIISRNNYRRVQMESSRRPGVLDWVIHRLEEAHSNGEDGRRVQIHNGGLRLK